MPQFVTDTTAPDGFTRAQGLHGGAGEITWRALAPASALAGDWYSLEYAVMPPGTDAALHTHTRTEELWLVTGGRARSHLGGRDYHVGPGTVLLTSVHGTHGQWPEGDDGDPPYTFAIALAFPRALAAGMPPLSPTAALDEGRLPAELRARKRAAAAATDDGADGPPAGEYFVGDLRAAAQDTADVHGGRGPARVGRVPGADLRRVLAAPWRAVEWVALAPGATAGPRTLPDSEVVIMVTGGAGVSHGDTNGQLPLKAGVAVTWPLGATVHLEQRGDAPLEFFLMELGAQAAPPTGPQQGTPAVAAERPAP